MQHKSANRLNKSWLKLLPGQAIVSPSQSYLRIGILGLPVEDGDIAPQTLKVVEGSGFLIKDVNNDIAVINEDPGAIVESLDTNRLRATSQKDVLFDSFGDGADLPVTCP